LCLLSLRDGSTDWDNLTLLFQRAGESGLECCANPRTLDESNMYWTAIPAIGSTGIAVNIGDMLARWSDKRLHSNLHRVRLPTGPTAQKPRYAIAYFAQSNRSTRMECDTAEPMTAGEYIASRVRSNFAGKKE
jgi:isopenicillin N synthase-like dioxygenase